MTKTLHNRLNAVDRAIQALIDELDRAPTGQAASIILELQDELQRAYDYAEAAEDP